MARFSTRGWLVPVGDFYRREDGQWMQDFKIRLWHPGFWVFWIRYRIIGRWLHGKSV